MESPIHRHNSVIFNYFASIITDFQLFVVSLQKIGYTSAIKRAYGVRFALSLHHLTITNNNKDMENLTDIIKGSQLTLVDFYATWCGPCKMMHPVLEQLKKELGDSIRVIKVDIDKNESTAMQMRIQSVPTLMLFQSGAMSLADLKATIAKYQ